MPNKHALRDPPDLRSKFLIQVERREIEKALAKQKIIDDDIKAKREVLLYFNQFQSVYIFYIFLNFKKRKLKKLNMIHSMEYDYMLGWQ